MFFKRRVVMQRAAGMNEAELAQCFDGNLNAPLWRGAMQVLDEEIVTQTDILLGTKERQRDEACGAVNGLLTLKQRLLDLQGKR
jgi:hypothetical protein